MSRPIRFRAWDKKSKRMVPVDNLHWRIGGELGGMSYFPSEVEEVGRPRKMFELMQYTGLKDKKGTEIYEGDIVKVDGKVVQMIWDNENAKFVNVEIEYGSEFKIDRSKPPKDHKDMEVIGNVFENEELLNEKD